MSRSKGRAVCHFTKQDVNPQQVKNTFYLHLETAVTTKGSTFMYGHLEGYDTDIMKQNNFK